MATASWNARAPTIAEKICDLDRRYVRLGQDVTRLRARITLTQTISYAPSQAKRLVPRPQIASSYSFFAGLEYNIQA